MMAMASSLETTFLLLFEPAQKADPILWVNKVILDMLNQISSEKPTWTLEIHHHHQLC
jgi:hypothetical protein